MENCISGEILRGIDSSASKKKCRIRFYLYDKWKENWVLGNYGIIGHVKLFHYLKQTSYLIKSINILFKKLSKVTGGS